MYEEYKNEVGKKQASSDNMVEPNSKRRRISTSPTDEGMFNPIQLDHSYARAVLPIDKIKEEPIVEEIDMNELFVEFQQGKNSEWQQMEMEIVSEEADPDAFVKEEQEEEQQLYYEQANTISGNNTTIVQLNQRQDSQLSQQLSSITFGIEEGATASMSQRRRSSNNSNYDGMSLDSIDSEHTDTASESLFDEANKIKEEPFVEEIDMNELFGGFIQGRTCDWQRLGVEIVREEADPGEFVKEESIYDGYGTQLTNMQIDCFNNSMKWEHS